MINIFCLTISLRIQQALEAELCHQGLETFRSRQAVATLAAWTRSDRLATCLKWSAIRRMPSWMEPRRRPIDPMSSCTPVFSFLELYYCFSLYLFFLFVSFCPLYCFVFFYFFALYFLSLSLDRSITINHIVFITLRQERNYIYFVYWKQKVCKLTYFTHLFY